MNIPTSYRRALLTALILCSLFTPFSLPQSQAQRRTSPAKMATQKMLNALAAAYTQHAMNAGDVAFRNHFGYSVSVSADGNTALVGAHSDDNSGGWNAGSVYVFTRSGTT